MATAKADEIAQLFTLLSATQAQQQQQMYFELLGRAFSQISTAGWGAPTGTATRTTFDTATVTLPLLAQRVKALLDDLTSTGLLKP